MKGVKFFPLLKNAIKKFYLLNFIYPLLFSVLMWFVLGFSTKLQYFLIISFIFIISYIFTRFLLVLKALYKKTYYIILIVAILFIIMSFIPNFNILNINYGSLIWCISSFLILHRVFYSTYSWIFPVERRAKLQQKLRFGKQRIAILIRNLQISPLHLLILNFLVLAILLIFEYFYVLNFSIASDTIVQINVTIYALILPLSLAIVTSNEYSKISRYYIELYQGGNLLFFLSYLFVISISLIYSNNIISILSIFMIVNTFVFILNLAKQTSSENIVGRLFNKLENEINKGNYSFIKSTKSKLNWSDIKGFEINVGVVDINKEFEYNIDLLNQLAIKATQNKDRDTFTRIIRGYLNLSRFFLIVCKKDKAKVSNLLSQIQVLSLQAKLDDEFLNILVNELMYDYDLHEFFIDTQIWNLQRFKLMISIAESNKENKKRFNHIISTLIKMLISNMKGKFGPQIKYDQIKNTGEYKELEKVIKNNRKNIIAIQIRETLNRYEYENESEKKFFEESKKKILKELFKGD